MKIFFVFLLAVSVVALFYLPKTIMAHNHYETRYYQLNAESATPQGAGWLGLTRTELSLCPDKVQEAYKASVEDAYKMGRGYSTLFVKYFVLVVLLLVSSIFGIRAVGKRDCPPNGISN